MVMRRVLSLLSSMAIGGPLMAATLPGGFEQEVVISGLQDPATMAFSPDGRLFVSERVLGQLRVATWDSGTDSWTLNPQPFYTFDVPTDGNGTPEAHRSSGLRGFVFDPDFETNGYVYCFYMKDSPRHNRVVRIQASAGDPNVADPTETLLFEMPFAGGDSSGSHNGGALAFGGDGLLYFTTGDGWNGGDDVQSLSTHTGKVFRIQPDGTIPTDNPFYNNATGAYRAVYALGLRNPFSMAVHPESGEIYINDVGGPNKARVLRLAVGANYGHDGYDGIGVETDDWSNVGTGGSSGRIVSGGVWYPSCGTFGPAFHGVYFASLWGGNGGDSGELVTLASEASPMLEAFATDVGYSDPAGRVKPMYVALDPRGNLFYLASSYSADDGRVFRVRPIGSAGADPCSIAGVPTMSGWSALLMALLLVTCGTLALRRRVDPVGLRV